MGKHRRLSARQRRMLKSAVAFATAATAAVSASSYASAVPKVASQPGTEKPEAPAAEPEVYAQAAPVQQVAPVQPQAVAFIPGAQQAAVQPVVKKVVVQQNIIKVVKYETSPGLALATAGGSRVLNPVNVANTFERNVAAEDRETINMAKGAAAGGAVAGTVIGAAAGAAVGGAAGVAAGAGASTVICASTTAAVPVAPPLAPVAAGCWAMGPAAGAVVGGLSGAGAGAVAAAPAGALAGAQLGATAVPGGRAALDRTVANTTWDLESQARVANGAEPLAGEKPGDSMPNSQQAKNQGYVPPSMPDAQALSSQAALSMQSQVPNLPPAPVPPGSSITGVPNVALPQVNV